MNGSGNDAIVIPSQFSYGSKMLLFKSSSRALLFTTHSAQYSIEFQWITKNSNQSSKQKVRRGEKKYSKNINGSIHNTQHYNNESKL